MHIDFVGDLNISNFPTAEEARKLYENNFRQAYTVGHIRTLFISFHLIHDPSQPLEFEL